jgi:preprotein translocase subunit SecD
VIRKRLAKLDHEGRVERAGNQIVVDLAAADLDRLADVRDAIARTGRFEVKRLADAAVIAPLVERARREPAGKIEVRVDEWTSRSTSKRFSVPYLFARERANIDQFVRAGSSLPADVELVYERFDSGWRSYAVQRKPVLTGDSVTRATAGEHGVEIQLDAKGRAALDEVTTAIVGDKLVIAIDARVVVAPIIEGAISHGTLILDLGETATPRDARELSVVLEGGALPSALREETVSEIENGKVLPRPTE